MSNSNESELNQCLTFTLGKEIFALDISKVREVLEITKVSEIPRTPDFMRGVINLRGNAVPVVDMRLKFGMSQIENTVDTCIIILEVNYAGAILMLGALVDSVREVVNMSEKDIEPAPRMGAAVKADYIKGMARQGNQFIIIIDVDAVFSEAELSISIDAKANSKGLAA
jgi:purine-binding chemotaxis protein CheW